MQKYYKLPLIMAAMLLLFVAASESHAAKPYFKKGSNTLIAVVKFQNDCWDEIYARATPKNSNNEVLNKQSIYNNDKPDNGPSEVIKLKWRVDSSKMDKTSGTNEGKIRYYVEIELVGHIQGETVTKYKSFTAGDNTLDFGTFFMHTNPELCQR